MMGEPSIEYIINYSPVGDITVMAICFVFAILIRASYINRTRNYGIFRRILLLLFISAMTNVSYHMFLEKGYSWRIATYIARALYHLSISGMMVLFVAYIMETMHLEEKKEKRFIIIASIVYFLVLAYEIVGYFLKIGFHVAPDGTVVSGLNLFPICHLFYVGLNLYIMYTYRSRVYKQVMYGVAGAIGISFLMLIIQQFFRQTSFTAATFLFPTFALLYLVHSNPYDIETGSLNAAAFDDLIEDRYRKKKQTLLMSLYLKEFDGNGVRYPKGIQETIRQFTTFYFNSSVLFQMSNGHMILAIPIDLNPHYEVQVGEILGNFAEVYPKYRLDYKIVIVQTCKELDERNEYASMIQYMESRMQLNQTRYVKDADIELFKKQKYILEQMEEIQKNQNLNDERVVVYCQPVMNIETGEYDTAEALMRMKLEKIGMVFPDQFIPIAEQHGYIHVMSRIILHKTCMQIKRLLDNGYLVKRISVNFSISDIRQEHFCEMVEKIIGDSGIPNNRIAIEVTESQNENDFMILKDKINELRKCGIKFYLDDFGTGYSNFERIMQLPFDIIKFDRSLVIASGNSEKSMLMVEHLAKMFSDMNYAVLYEGVESDQDEERCEKMSARYLQGYKYSRPIPIEKLSEYFQCVD